MFQNESDLSFHFLRNVILFASDERIISKYVKSIGKNAFIGCKALKIDVKTTKLTEKNVGNGAFRNIHGKAVFKCPKKKLKAYRELFIKKDAPKTCTFE